MSEEEKQSDFTEEFVKLDALLDDEDRKPKPRLFVPQTRIKGVKSIEDVVAELCDRCSFLSEKMVILEHEIRLLKK